MADLVNNFSHAELSSISEHLVSLRVSIIKEIKDEWDEFEKDPEIFFEELKDDFDRMIVIWKELAPARGVARVLFPALGSLFDILDKAISIEQDVVSHVQSSQK